MNPRKEDGGDATKTALGGGVEGKMGRRDSTRLETETSKGEERIQRDGSDKSSKKFKLRDASVPYHRFIKRENMPW